MKLDLDTLMQARELNMQRALASFFNRPRYAYVSYMSASANLWWPEKEVRCHD